MYDDQSRYSKGLWQIELAVYGENVGGLWLLSGLVEWVMGLVTTPFFNIVLNGSPTITFHPTHSIRQGDPLSPFLFILMAEGLSHLIMS